MVQSEIPLHPPSPVFIFVVCINRTVLTLLQYHISTAVVLLGTMGVGAKIVKNAGDPPWVAVAVYAKEDVAVCGLGILKW